MNMSALLEISPPMAQSEQDCHLQHPQLPISQVEEKFGPGQRIGLCISSVGLNPLFHKFCLRGSKKALFVSLVGEIDDEEPSGYRHELGEKAFYDLIECQRMVRDVSTDPARALLTKIHCHPRSPPTPSICIRP